MFGRKKAEKTEATAKGEKPAKIENPYLANRFDSDDRYMNLAVSRQNWVKAFLISSALLAVSIGFNGYYMTQSKFIPYIVVTDKIGHVVNVGVADKTNPVDMKRIVRAGVIEWVQNSRFIVSDKLAQKKLIGDVYAHVASTGKSKTQLDAYYKQRNVFETAEKQTVSAEVTIALPTAGDSWQVEWTETMRNTAGEIVGTERWKGIFTIAITPMNTEESIRANPSGLFITDFTWSKQI
jgi:type IV secretion system protein VirB5